MSALVVNYLFELYSQKMEPFTHLLYFNAFVQLPAPDTATLVALLDSGRACSTTGVLFATSPNSEIFKTIEVVAKLRGSRPFHEKCPKQLHFLKELRRKKTIFPPHKFNWDQSRTETYF